MGIGGHWEKYTELELKLHGEISTRMNIETWKDPQVRASRIQGLKKACNNEIHRMNISNRMKKFYSLAENKLNLKLRVKRTWDSPQGQIRRQKLSDDMSNPNSIRYILNKKRMVENNPNKNGYITKGKALLISNWEVFTTNLKVFTLLELHSLCENLCSTDMCRGFLKQLALKNKINIFIEKGQQFIYYINGLDELDLQRLIDEKKEILHMKRKTIQKELQKELQNRSEVAEKRNFNRQLVNIRKAKEKNSENFLWE